MKPKLTIGMPTYDDYHGCIFTLQSLRLNNDLREVELLVVDNNPASPGSKMIKDALAGPLRGNCAGTKYVAYEEAVGPANAKNRVFEEASGDIVLCIDSHILFKPGTIQKLLKWYDDHPDSQDLICGPLLYDDLHNISTHFDDVWRGEMWGIWGTAWATPEGKTFSVLNEGDVAVCVDIGRGLGRYVIEEYSNIPYYGHEKFLLELGCKMLGRNDDDEFEIPGNGCGLISCRKSAWLGFNKAFGGFGGEEMYIHEKFRQAGHKAISLGFLQWWHRFGRPEGVKYPLRRDQKVRNYILGHKELGMSLDRVHEHFVASGLMPQNEWDFLNAHADNSEQAIKNRETMVVPEPKNIVRDIPAIFNEIVGVPRDLNKHMKYLALLVEKCPRVTEFSHRRESFIAFASGNPTKLVSYNEEVNNSVYKEVQSLFTNELVVKKAQSAEIAEIEETDLLFIDQRHTKDDVYRELRTFGPKTTRFIVLHDTELYGEKGEDGGPGLWDAIKQFMKENPKWYVQFHVAVQYGLTVLGCLEEDRPIKVLRPWNMNKGPGEELTQILANSFGVVAGSSCDCKAKARIMNSWGVEGCRENREEIIKWITDNQERWGWKEKIQVGIENGVQIEKPVLVKKNLLEKTLSYFKAAKGAIRLGLNPLKPIESLVDLCIERAAIKEANGEYDD